MESRRYPSSLYPADIKPTLPIPQVAHTNHLQQANFLSHLHLHSLPMPNYQRYSPYHHPTRIPGASTSGTNTANIINRQLQHQRARVHGCPDEKIVTTHQGQTILHIAISKCDINLQRALFEAMLARPAVKTLVNKVNGRNQTPLFIAVVKKQQETISRLLGFGADPNIMADMKDLCGGEDKISPLHYAASFGNRYLDEVQILLQSNIIHIDVLSSSGMTPLQMAIWKHGTTSSADNFPINSREVVRTLLQAGASCEIRDNRSGRSALHFAVEREDEQLLSIILEHYQDPVKKKAVLEQMTYSKQTPLHLAAGLRVPEQRQLKIVHVLLKHGANKNCRDHERQYPRDLVTEQHFQVRELLSTNYHPELASPLNLGTPPS